MCFYISSSFSRLSLAHKASAGKEIHSKILPSFRNPPLLFASSFSGNQLKVRNLEALHPALKKVILLEVNVGKLSIHLTPFRSPIIIGLLEYCCFPKVEMSGKGEIRL
jgi:hypothetical protein